MRTVDYPKQTSKDCVYWQQTWRDPLRKFPSMGDCRIVAPIRLNDDRTGWPKTSEDYWCGQLDDRKVEYSEKEL